MAQQSATDDGGCCPYPAQRVLLCRHSWLRWLVYMLSRAAHPWSSSLHRCCSLCKRKLGQWQGPVLLIITEN